MRLPKRATPIAGAVAVALTFVAAEAAAADVPADPSNYRSLFDSLSPGDVLVLAAGDYTDGLRISDMHGADGLPITIRGPATGAPAVFLARGGSNTIDLENASFVVIRHLTFDGQDIEVDAIKAGGASGSFTHDITIEGCVITRHDGAKANQQVVGISTKIVSWNWVVRGNVIDGAGTGAYFGDSDGSGAFIGGLVEGNLFRRSLGYGMQIKHQNDRGQTDVPTVPTDPRVTVIRHNVFVKTDDPSPDGVRPNLLVGGFPDSGPGSDDGYDIYGNLFLHNPNEPLLQATGRVHVHDNVFVDSAQAAISFTAHQGKSMIDAVAYNNTIYSTATGISVSGSPSGQVFVGANAIFSPNPLSGTAGFDDLTDSVANAGTYVANPSVDLGTMDFFPVAASALQGSTIDLSAVSGDLEYDRDFNGTTKDFTWRGAYSGAGTNPGWPIADEPKPIPGGSAGTAGTGAGGSSGAGTGATGGTSGSGGVGATAGTGDAGASATGGAGGTAGSIGSGAAAGAAGTGTGGTSAQTPGGSSSDDGGCGCRVPSRGGSPVALLVAVTAWLARRRGAR